MKIKLLALALVAISGNISASELQGRVDLMKYAIELERSLPLNLDKEPTYTFNFKLIDDAHAYREGETCLILGFKSKFQKGMCRLSAAEGAKELQKECSSSQYACNPQVFGSAAESKPFCVSKSIRRDLSKACAHENIKFVQKKKPSNHLKEVLGNSAASFDLDKLDVTKLESETLSELRSTFGNQESAIQFTQSLCEDLKQSEKTGHQPFDSKICDAQLKTLIASHEKKEEPKKEIPKKEIPKKALTITPKTKANIEDCVACKQKAPASVIKDIENNVEDIHEVTKNTDAISYYACINEIEKHPEIKKQIDDINSWGEEYSRKTGYWHQLDGQKNFGLLCDIFHESKEEFVFVNENGFKMVSNVKDEIRGAETVSQFKSGNTDYYIVQDILGNYFELVPKAKLSSASEDARADVAKYHKRGGKQSGTLKNIESSEVDFAKSCVKQRLLDYVDWMTYKKSPMPNVAQFNADIGIYNSGERESLKQKYGTPVDEVLKARFTDIMTPIPACSGIITEKDFDATYRDLQKEKIVLYEKMRGILGLN